MLDAYILQLGYAFMDINLFYQCDVFSFVHNVDYWNTFINLYTTYFFNWLLLVGKKKILLHFKLLYAQCSVEEETLLSN